MALTPEEFVTLFNAGTLDNAPASIFEPSLCGRIMQGSVESDFEKLSSSKEVAWLVGHKELLSMVGKTGYQILHNIGLTNHNIRLKLKAGNRYRLLVFPQLEAVPATWEGVLRTTITAHASLENLNLEGHLTTLKSKSFFELQEMARFNFVEAKDAGAKSPNFVDVLKLTTNAHCPGHVRAFLYHSVGCNHLFVGNGKSMNESGEITGDEFITLNKRVSDIPGAVMIHLDVQLPQQHVNE